MDKADIMHFLMNFTGGDFESETSKVYNLKRPFVREDKIISTSGHVMLVIDKEVEPQAYDIIRNGKLEGEQPNCLSLIEGYGKFKRNRPFRQSELDELKIKYNYPYHAFNLNWPKSESAGGVRDCGEDCPVSMVKRIPFDEGFFIDLKYLMLMEAIMLYFGGTWTVWFPENTREQIIFTNGKVLYAVMPMAPCK